MSERMAERMAERISEQTTAQAKPTPNLPPEFGYDLDGGELTVYLGPDEERLDILRFGEDWSAEAVEEAVHDWDREMLAFAEKFFALYRELFAEETAS